MMKLESEGVMRGVTGKEPWKITKSLWDEFDVLLISDTQRRFGNAKTSKVGMG